MVRASLQVKFEHSCFKGMTPLPPWKNFLLARRSLYTNYRLLACSHWHWSTDDGSGYYSTLTAFVEYTMQHWHLLCSSQICFSFSVPMNRLSQSFCEEHKVPTHKVQINYSRPRLPLKSSHQGRTPWCACLNIFKIKRQQRTHWKQDASSDHQQGFRPFILDNFETVSQHGQWRDCLLVKGRNDFLLFENHARSRGEVDFRSKSSPDTCPNLH